MTPKNLKAALLSRDRAQEALDTAKAERRDPWRITELKMKLESATQRVLDIEAGVPLEGEGPRGPAMPWPVR